MNILLGLILLGPGHLELLSPDWLRLSGPDSCQTMLPSVHQVVFEILALIRELLGTKRFLVIRTQLLLIAAISSTANSVRRRCDIMERIKQSSKAQESGS